MVAYRFCRPDDNPYIVEAVNECCLPHFPDQPEFLLEDFQTEIRELDVWPSNCMVASEASRPVAVCIATKRPEEVLIRRVGARPGFERRGHGAHMLTSLSQKLAVLGPERLVVELPADRADLQAFFEAVGYRRETAFQDFVLGRPLSTPSDLTLLTPIGVEDLIEMGLLSEGTQPSWERQTGTLAQRSDQIHGWSVVAGDTLSGWVLARDSGGERQIVAAGFEAGTAQAVAALILGQMGRDGLGLRMVKLLPEELKHLPLVELGFEPAATTYRYVAVATPL